ncbi:MAG: helicase C-terminal domain-containing protein, partial [Haliea sp.]
MLVAVPSRARGEAWRDFAVLPERQDFTEKLDAFRQSTAGGFVLAGRFDGIDLPGAQCRVMVIDGLPTAGGLMEQYLFERLHMDHFLANTISVRLTQLFGRIIRGRQDYGFFLIADRAVENWLKNERNRSLLPELLRRQLFLSEEIEGQISGAIGSKVAIETMNKVLGREEDWVDFYRDNINDLDVPDSRLRDNAEEDEVFTEAGKSEVRFMTKLWDEDTAGAREELESVFKDVAIHDAVLAGWYSIWIGMTFYAEGNTDAALDMFDEARSRIGRNLPLPRRKITEIKAEEPPRTLIEQAIRSVSAGSVMRVNDQLARLRAST